MEKKDIIKQFIDQNRDVFDDAPLPDSLWAGIEKKLPKDKKVRMVPLKSVLRIAAGIAILVTVGLYSLLKNQPSSPPIIASKDDVEKQEIIYTHYPELAEAAFYYQSQIDIAETELAEYEIDENDMESVKSLETEMKALKAEMGDQVDNERLIQAMMQIYKYKLDMLNKMLKHIKSTENHSDEKDNVVPL